MAFLANSLRTAQREALLIQHIREKSDLLCKGTKLTSLGPYSFLGPKETGRTILKTKELNSTVYTRVSTSRHHCLVSQFQLSQEIRESFPRKTGASANLQVFENDSFSKKRRTWEKKSSSLSLHAETSKDT